MHRSAGNFYNQGQNSRNCIGFHDWKGRLKFYKVADLIVISQKVGKCSTWDMLKKPQLFGLKIF